MADALTYSPAGPGVERRSPLVELLLLAGPTIAQMASYTLMQFIDTWMLTHVGTRVNEPTAGSNGGMLAFSVISLGMGTLWVVNTLVSQSFGRRDFSACGRYLWQGIWFAVAFSILLLPAVPFVSLAFKAVGHRADIIRLETLYLQIMLCGSAMKLIGTACSQFLLAVDRPNAVMISTVIGISANVMAAWVMIFGHLGFRPMGVAGSAWGQNVGVFVEMSCCIFFVSRPAMRKTFNVRDFKPRLTLFLTLLRVGIPAGVQLLAEVLAWSVFAIGVMSLFGTNVMAANTFIFRFMSVSFMPAYGISVAVTALVGRDLGMGDLASARRRADLAFALAAAYMLACGLLFFLGRNVLMGMFTVNPEVLRVGAMLLIFAAIYQFFDAMCIIYSGALRGAGDTFIPAVTTASLCWGVTVLGGYAVARFHTNWGPAGPWTAASIYGAMVGMFVMVRFRSGQWRAIPDDSGFQRAPQCV
jgi:MATE family multidrug resistance protein